MNKKSKLRSQRVKRMFKMIKWISYHRLKQWQIHQINHFKEFLIQEEAQLISLWFFSILIRIKKICKKVNLVRVMSLKLMFKEKLALPPRNLLILLSQVSIISRSRLEKKTFCFPRLRLSSQTSIISSMTWGAKEIILLSTVSTSFGRLQLVWW